jgi:hypothetical protein
LADNRVICRYKDYAGKGNTRSEAYRAMIEMWDKKDRYEQ